MKPSFHEKLFWKEKKLCYGFMPGDSQVICGSMVDENHWSPASTETPANHPLWGEHVWALYGQIKKHS